MVFRQLKPKLTVGNAPFADYIRTLNGLPQLEVKFSGKDGLTG